MTFVLHFYAIYGEITSTTHDGHFPDPYKFRLSYQTYHFEIVSFSTFERSLSISVTTGIFTRVDCQRINKLDLPQKFQNFAIDSMVILTRMILYNHMIVNGSYHKFFSFTEQSHLL